MPSTPPYDPEPVYRDLLLILYQHRLSASVGEMDVLDAARWPERVTTADGAPASLAVQRADRRSTVAKRMSWLVAFTLVESFFSRKIFDHLRQRLANDLLHAVWPAVDGIPIHEKVFVWTRIITGRRMRGVTDRDLNTLRELRNAIAHGRHEAVAPKLDDAPWRDPLTLSGKILRGFYAAAGIPDAEQLFDPAEERRLLGDGDGPDEDPGGRGLPGEHAP